KRFTALRLLKKRQDAARYRETQEVWAEQAFDLDRFSDVDCWRMFRVRKDDIDRLRVALRIPESVRTSERDRCTGTEALCIVLRRMSYPNRWCDLRAIFGRSHGSLMRIFYHTLETIDAHWSHLLRDLEQRWLMEGDFDEFSRAIAAKGGVYPGVIGFIDGTAREICRPKRYQRIMYSGHKRFHCTKWQSVLFPNGMIGNLYGGKEGSMHDSRLFAESNFLQQFRDKQANFQQKYYIYGDSGHGRKDLLIKPFSQVEAASNPLKEALNEAMSTVRESVEWGFKEVVKEFAFVDFKKQMKIFENPVNKIFRIAVLLTNCRNCLYPNQASQYFNLEPPFLKEYLRD
ncbi:uncharacterized protein LOC129590913, partial [Paramacrobiotus metropolitanus]|uniref:uncharacterized protein LOC129590913 n=1 Tax=Paramacrobiotus metropolitanus TaxID=2943436 RepID=UPI002445C51F